VTNQGGEKAARAADAVAAGIIRTELHAPSRRRPDER
jgi:hypothetical protein